jgi:hypothetical protein
MKRLFTLVSTLLLGAVLALGQTGGDKSTLNPQPLPPGRHPQAETKTTAKKGHKGGKKGHKGGKKSKKGSGGSTTPPPK